MKAKMLYDVSETTANIKGAASIGLAAVSWIAELESWLQIGATVAAIAVGVTAAMWNFEKYRAARKARKDSEEKD